MRRGQKSRNGCARCKKQRLKCDEAKPACGRCVRVGCPCPGPVRTLRWSNKHEVFQMNRGDGHAGDSSASSSGLTGGTASAPLTPPMELPELATTTLEAPPSVSAESNSDRRTLALHDHMGFPQTGGSMEFPNADWNSQMLGHVFPWFLDAFDNPGGGVFQTPGILPRDESSAWEAPTSSSTGELEAVGPLSSVLLPQPERLHQPSEALKSASKSRRKDITRSLFTPLRHGPKDKTTMLVECYFRSTAPAYSIYDSDMNPFRSTVSRLWDSSRVIYLSLQSMAAACLVEIYPSLASVGEQLRREALNLLTVRESEDKFDDKDLLALLMLGGTSGWHDPQDMGVPLFNSFRKHVERVRSSEQFFLENSNSLRFFQESLMYWEMLLAYVVDDDKLDKSTWAAPIADLDLVGSSAMSNRIPHPWTGVARDTQILVQEVGRLVRSHRLRAHRRSFTTQATVAQMQSEMRRASELETELLNLEPPTESEVVSPEDRQTPVWHLLSLAEVYCRVGLLQLYRVFPDVLRARLEADGGQEHELSQSLCDEWLTAFALRTLDLLKPIPVESGTRDFQPFLLVACSSELRYPPGRSITHKQDTERFLDTSNSMQVIEVFRARGLVLNRLEAFLHCLPPKPIRRCIDIVQETWRMMDEQAKNTESDEAGNTVYWIDVMIERGWETTMG